MAEYVLGTHDEELWRLGLQHQVWRAQATALWEKAGFGPGQTLLDIGCGPGFCTRDLAWVVGASGRIVAIDESPRYVEFVNTTPNGTGAAVIDARVGDVQALDLPEQCLDGAYARWVFCFLRHPEQAIDGVYRALKPGGRLVIQDYVHYLAMSLSPSGPALDRVASAVRQSWALSGGDCNIGRRLPHLLVERGFRIDSIQPTVRVGTPGTLLWEWPTTFFKIFVPTLVRMGLLTENEQEEFVLEWEQRSQDPQSRFYTPIVLDLVATKIG